MQNGSAIELGGARLLDNKQCSGACRQIKPLSYFCKNKSKKDGHESQCKACVSKSKARLYKSKKKKLKGRDKFESSIVGQLASQHSDEFSQVFGLAIKEIAE